MSEHRPRITIDALRDRLRSRGLRWTNQRRTLVEVLSGSNGHLTGSELVERSRDVDPSTTPSTVYRTLDVLEELGLIRHSHGIDGREEFHFLPEQEHGHLHCPSCGRSWQIDPEESAAVAATFAERRGFAMDVSHLTVVGLCVDCRARLDR